MSVSQLPTPQTQPEKDSLRIALGQSFEAFGRELQKQVPDPVAMDQNQQIIAQIQKILEQARLEAEGPSQSTDLTPQSGVPQQVPGRVDSLTRQPQLPRGQ